MRNRWSIVGAFMMLAGVISCSDDGSNEDGATTDDQRSTGGGRTGGAATGSGFGVTGGAAGATGGDTAGGESATTGGALAGGAGTAGAPAGGAETGGAEMGGAETGGEASGGAATAGTATGGEASAGAETGGESSAGAATGGAAAGGAETGGEASAGAETGGEASAGAETGGEASGGAATAGTAAGGAATGGEASGGAATGGAAGRGNTCPADVPELANASVPPGFCAWTWATNVSDVRGATVNANGDFIVIVRGDNAVVLLHDDDGDGISGSDERVELASASGINHGITIHDGYLYASSPTAVHRWPYSGGRDPLSGQETVITDVPGGGHSTRTLALDSAGYLYVSVGSQGNLDSNSDRARVVRFSPEQVSSGATYAQHEVWADGTRNEVGLRFDLQGRLWGVENGSDNVHQQRSDLGGDIHNDNPGEEVNLFDQAGFYGYPRCWSEGVLEAPYAMGPGTQWGYSSADDDWCRDTNNVIPPAMVMQAHSAPLDIYFYPGGSFPDDMVGDAFVTFHGSWNRDPATGYKVVRLPFDSSGLPSGAVEPLLEYSGSGDTGGGWPHRPVAMSATPDGKLLVTSDASSVIIAIGHDGS